MSGGAGRPDAPAARRARARAAAVTVAGAFAAWTALGWIGGAAGWPVGLALAFDAACLAALGWAIYVAIGLWRAEHRDGRDGGR